MLCGSCEQQQVVPPPLPIRTAAACAFDASTVVVELSDQSDPAGYGECAWRSGQCLGQPAKAANPTIPADRMRFIQGKIQDAFDNAPAHLQTELCTLRQIYIDPKANSQNWGLRDVRTPDNSTYIGVADAMFDAAAPQPYSLFETLTVRNLLTVPPPPPPVVNLPPQSNTWLQTVSHSANPADTLTVKVMAILAHEMGHVIWWAENIPGVTCPPTNGNFQDISWQVHNTPRGFHKYGRGHSNQNKVETFTETDMVDDLWRGRVNALILKMKKIYSQSNWVNLFSFVDPDEDFIETYRFWALTHAQGGLALTSLNVQFADADGSQVTRPIVTNGSFGGTNTDLLTKRQWIEEWIKGPSPAGRCSFPAPWVAKGGYR